VRPDHILVEPASGQITGVIDWEMAGWWLAYGEYAKPLLGNRHEPWWKTLLPEILHPYPNELRFEVDRQQS
jgi:hypothetical protein